MPRERGREAVGSEIFWFIQIPIMQTKWIEHNLAYMKRVKNGKILHKNY